MQQPLVYFKYTHFQHFYDTKRRILRTMDKDQAIIIPGLIDTSEVEQNDIDINSSHDTEKLQQKIDEQVSCTQDDVGRSELIVDLIETRSLDIQEQLHKNYSSSVSSILEKNDIVDSKDDDESIFQCHSLEYDDAPIWERALFRISATAAAVATPPLQSTTTRTTHNLDHRAPAPSSAAATTPTTVVHHPPAPSRKMFLAHTESRDYAYDIGDHDVDNFSFDTNHSDFFIQSLPSKQRLSFTQRQYSHIYRNNINRDSATTAAGTSSGKSHDESQHNVNQYYQDMHHTYYNHQSFNEILAPSLSRGRALNSISTMRTGTATTVSSSTITTAPHFLYSIRSCTSSNMLQTKDSESTLELQSSSFTSYAPICKAGAIDGGLGACDDMLSTTSSEEEDDDYEWDCQRSQSASSGVVPVDNNDVDDVYGIVQGTTCWDFSNCEMTAPCENNE